MRLPPGLEFGFVAKDQAIGALEDQHGTTRVPKIGCLLSVCKAYGTRMATGKGVQSAARRSKHEKRRATARRGADDTALMPKELEVGVDLRDAVGRGADALAGVNDSKEQPADKSAHGPCPEACEFSGVAAEKLDPVCNAQTADNDVHTHTPLV